MEANKLFPTNNYSNNKDCRYDSTDLAISISEEVMEKASKGDSKCLEILREVKNKLCHHHQEMKKALDKTEVKI